MNYNGTTHDIILLWLDSEMHGVKPSENKVEDQEQTRNQGLHFSVGDNKDLLSDSKKNLVANS